MATPEKQTQDVPQKPESIFASINKRSFRSIADKPFQLFRTWFLVVYHPRDFFSYFFGSSTHLTVDSTILLGMLKYDIDTKEKRILDPLWFLIESVAVVLVANAVTIHLILKMRIHGERLSAELPKLTELGFVNDAVFSLCFVALIAICSVLQSLYVFLVCKKATMKKMIDLYMYLNTSQFLVLSVGGVVAVFSLTTIFSNFPTTGTNNQGIEYFLLFFAMASMYSFVFLYVSMDLALRLHFANVVVVLREIFREDRLRIALVFVIPAICIIAFFSIMLHE